MKQSRSSHLLVLLGWFPAPTPVGLYNPDWAIVMNDPQDGQPMLYLVRESKGSTKLDDLRPDEKRKILCGEKHFKDALGVDFGVVKTAGELL